MTKVVAIANPRTDPEYAQGFHYAVEVRDSEKGLIHRWTFRTYAHAEHERKHVASWYYLPTSVLHDSGPIVTGLVLMLVPWAILAMACGR